MNDVQEEIRDQNGHIESTEARSLVDELVRANAHAKQHFDRAIPHQFKGKVVVRYGFVSRRTAAKVANYGVAKFSAAYLVEACREVFVRAEDGSLVPCREAAAVERAVKFDGNLADLFKLGDKATTPERICAAIFGHNDRAMDATVEAHHKWQTGADLNDLSPEEVEELLGEEEAAT